MTTRSSSTADAPYVAPSPVSSHGAGRRDAAAPYVQPARPAVDAVLIDAIRASAGPYVPAPWRMTTEHTTTETASTAAPMPNADAASTALVADSSAGDSSASAELPWIDAFLDAAPATAEVDPTSFETRESTPVSSLFGDEHEAPGSPTAAEITVGDLEAEAPAVDEWPLDEAGAALRRIAEGIAADDAPSRGAMNESLRNDADVAPTQPTEALPMWADDDLMDIMPVKAAPHGNGADEHWAAHARQESPDGSSAAAASALEALARRLRDGDLTLPGYRSEMGEAAALAAALAALLGERRG